MRETGTERGREREIVLVPFYHSVCGMMATCVVFYSFVNNVCKMLLANMFSTGY